MPSEHINEPLGGIHKGLAILSSGLGHHEGERAYDNTSGL